MSKEKKYNQKNDKAPEATTVKEKELPKLRSVSSRKLRNSDGNGK